MPMTKGYSSKSIGKNIKMEEKAGKPGKPGKAQKGQKMKAGLYANIHAKRERIEKQKAAGKKPVKVRKPSRPIDGINHRLLKKQSAQVEAVKVPDENAAPTRIELVEKAKELGLTFTKRTSDEKLLAMITEALNKQEA